MYTSGVGRGGVQNIVYTAHSNLTYIKSNRDFEYHPLLGLLNHVTHEVVMREAEGMGRGVACRGKK